MILRILNPVVICALVMAAAYVYRIKFDSTVQAERLAKIRGEIRRERDAIAGLRAEWGELDSPARIEALTKRYLPLKPVVPTQFDTFNQLPERPPQFFKPDSPDPIGAAIEKLEEPDGATGSIARQSGPAPANVAPADTAPGDAAPGDTAPADAAPADDASADMMPSDITPSDNAADDAGEEEAPAAKSGRLDR